MNAAADLESTLVWLLATLVVLLVVAPYGVHFARRRRADRARLAEARELGIDRPVAQFPFVDAARCIGCGGCVEACPEGDVLGVVGGVAVVVNGLRCVGHGRCADACPVGAIEIGVGDLKGRRDVPLLTDELETTVPGIFVAGELAGLALIRNAIEQGVAVIGTIAQRTRKLTSPRSAAAADVVVVGAGPAGISAALAARQRGLSAVVVDQSAGLGGTILQFPRRKLVLTQPIELPGGGAMTREEYAKEEVLELLGGEIERHRLPIRYGERLEGIERDGDELVVRTSAGRHRGRHVVLALGRRGTPRKLGVPGEERAKVMYQLRDAESYRGQRILVVGGGDSAVEAAIGLARQSGNRVTISYRKSEFFRIKRKNQETIAALIARGRVRAAFGSEVESIGSGSVVLRAGGLREKIDNDYVFVLVGGEPPFELLRRIGLRFGGDERPARSGAPACAPVVAARAGGVGASVLGALLAAAALVAPPLAAQASPHGEPAIACTECHTTADWTVGRNIPFRHESTGQPLTGAHAAAACAECHQSPVFSHVGTACSDCHRDAHQGELGLACSSCHDTRRWDVRSELWSAHNRTLFPLLAEHARVDCEACHGGQAPGQFANTPTDCISCHRPEFAAATSPPHQGFSTDCRQCHNAFVGGWRATGFQHSGRFALTAAHANLACEQCHTSGYEGTSADCFSCHRPAFESTRDPNHVAGRLPTTCQVCHSTAAWEPASFDHTLTGFVLQGAHVNLDCAQCHAGGYSGTSANCISCHRGDYDATRDPNHRSGGFSTTCQACHSTTAWEPASFDHARSSFPLTGAHRSVACETCHRSGYSGTPSTCVSCHRDDYDATRDPDHRSGGFPTTCQSCHDTTAWEPASFDHSRSSFPLTGAHRSVDCASCHRSGYSGTPSACVACHRDDYDRTQDPNHAAAGFPTACQSCHDTNSWDGADFDHDGRYFPIYSGAHRNKWSSCSTCHVAASNYRVFECTVCHEHSRSRMDDKHREVSNYRYDSQACYNCHPDGRGD